MPKVLSVAANLVMRAVWWCVGYLHRRDRGLVVFGAWGGASFSDNPKYLLIYMVEHTDMRAVWIGQADVEKQLPKHPRVQFALKNSKAATRALLSAGAWVCTHGISWDLTSLPIWGRAKLVNLWHGAGPKKMGFKAPWRIKHPDPRKSLIRKAYEFFYRTPRVWFVTPSECLVKVMFEGGCGNSKWERVLRFGTPRNDFLLLNRENMRLKRMLKEKYGKMLGFDPSKKIVLYLPTWRMSGASVFSFFGMPKEDRLALAEVLHCHNAVLLEKHHVKTLENSVPPSEAQCSVVIQNDKFCEIDTQELLLITDVLITEYSSAYIDFALLKRPVIHFAYDLDYYETEDQGIAYDYASVVAGPVVTDQQALLSAIENALTHPAFSHGSEYERLVQYETGRASEQVCEFLKSK